MKQDRHIFIKEHINSCIESEEENLQEAIKSAGSKCAGAAMAMGALDAYRDVLEYLTELDREVEFSND